MRGRAGFVHAHRRKSPRVFAAVIALAVATLAGCTRAPVPPYQQQILAFGTLVDITIADTEPSAAQAASAAVIRIANASINAGGDLRAIGRHGDRPWHIGIRDPRGPGILAAIDIDGDESVYTSGDYERYFDYEGKRYQHIIDPRSGYPAEGAMSATVIYPGGGVCGGAATALMVAGPQGWREVVRGMQLKYAMLVASDRTVYMTPAMAKRMHFEIDPAPRVVIGEP